MQLQIVVGLVTDKLMIYFTSWYNFYGFIFTCLHVEPMNLNNKNVYQPTSDPSLRESVPASIAFAY